MLIEKVNHDKDRPLINGIISPKWHMFQDALAGILKITIAVISAEGKLLTVQNALPPFSEFERHPGLLTAYSDFFRGIPRAYGAAGTERIFFDPLGLPVAAMPLGDGTFLILGGCLDKRDRQLLLDLKGRLSDLGVAEENKTWLKMASLSLEELKDNMAHVETLYIQMMRSLNETTDLGQKMLILSAVEEVNKLMVGTLNPEQFDLRRILDLVASSLVILSDSDGAIVFTYRQPAYSIATYRGECVELMESLKEEWETIAGGQEDPVDVFPRISKSRAVKLYGLSIETEMLKREETSAFLGVITPHGKYLHSALSAFIKQVVIALEVSSLYEVIQKRFGMLLNSIRQGIIVTDRAGKIMLLNQAAKNILGNQGITLALEDSLDGKRFCRQIVEAINHALEAGCAYSQKRSAIGSGDNLTHLRWDVAPLLKDDSSVAGAILIFDDITEPVNLFREIRDWEKLAAAGGVAASLAHEIRNPLATAKAAIQLFELVDNEEKRRELLGKLSNELDRMNQVLTTFLSSAKPIKEDLLQPVNIVRVVEDMELLLRNEAHLNEIDLAIELPEEEVPPVMGDPNSIKQVFLNIARNAIEAMAEGGRLDISVCRCNNQIKTSFRDNGPGIPFENLQHITRPFFTTKLGGTGLGLSISSSIIKMMGGELSISSRQGEGTTAEVFVPVCGSGESAIPCLERLN